METKGTLRIALMGTLALGLLLAVAPGSVSAEQGGHPQTLCPVMGGQIDKSAYVDYEGKRVYFCCQGCKEAFLERPDKYIKEMEAKGIVLEKAPGGSKGAAGGHGHEAGAHHGAEAHEGHGMHEGSMH